MGRDAEDMRKYAEERRDDGDTKKTGMMIKLEDEDRIRDAR